MAQATIEDILTTIPTVAPLDTAIKATYQGVIEEWRTLPDTPALVLILDGDGPDDTPVGDGKIARSATVIVGLVDKIGEGETQNEAKARLRKLFEQAAEVTPFFGGKVTNRALGDWEFGGLKNAEGEPVAVWTTLEIQYEDPDI